ncbi:MAG: DUF255 domain-containing protein [Candidatus Methanospirareceae archaeon]
MRCDPHDIEHVPRVEDKPIFLSIGYSTCHWCHVMARESFESEQTAGIPQRKLHLHRSGS